MRRVLTSLLAGSAVLAGCSSSDEAAETPRACLAGERAYLEALEAAPGKVRLERTTPISKCFTSGQDPAEQSQAGAAAIDAATTLNRKSRRRPSGGDTVKLGYLVGAVQRGASETGGIHADLVRRLDTAARFNEEARALSAAFERAFGRGYAAGQESG